MLSPGSARRSASSPRQDFDQIARADRSNVVRVDLRLRTTSSGLHDVGIRDGLRILVQVYVALAGA